MKIRGLGTKIDLLGKCPRFIAVLHGFSDVEVQELDSDGVRKSGTEISSDLMIFFNGKIT